MRSESNIWAFNLCSALPTRRKLRPEEVSQEACHKHLLECGRNLDVLMRAVGSHMCFSSQERSHYQLWWPCTRPPRLRLCVTVFFPKKKLAEKTVWLLPLKTILDMWGWGMEEFMIVVCSWGRNVSEPVDFFFFFLSPTSSFLRCQAGQSGSSGTHVVHLGLSKESCGARLHRDSLVFGPTKLRIKP